MNWMKSLVNRLIGRGATESCREAADSEIFRGQCPVCKNLVIVSRNKLLIVHWDGLDEQENPASGMNYRTMCNQCGTSLEFYPDQDKSEEGDVAWQAKNIDPVVRHFNLGIHYLSTGDRESAFAEYKNLQNLDESLANQLLKQLNK